MESRWNLVEEPESEQWLARRRMAAAVRSLIEACICTDVSGDELGTAADSVEELAKTLKQRQGPTFFEAIRDGSYGVNRGVYADRNPIVGHCNPLSPPMMMYSDGPKTIGEVTLGTAYEGIPGFLHGGFVAALLDQVFGLLMIREGLNSLTGKLEIKYLKPTPLHTMLRVEAQVKEISGRKVQCEGSIMAGGERVVSGTCLMVRVKKEQMRAIFEGGYASAST